MSDDPVGLASRSCPTCHGIGDNPACADPWHNPQPGVLHRIERDPPQRNALEEAVDDAAQAIVEPLAVVDQLRDRVAALEQAVASLIGGAPTGDWHTQTLRSVILHRTRKLLDQAASDVPILGVDVISMFLDTTEGTNPAPVLVIWARGIALKGPDKTLMSWHALPGWEPEDHDLEAIVRRMTESIRAGRTGQLQRSAPGVINHRATTHWAP